MVKQKRCNDDKKPQTHIALFQYDKDDSGEQPYYTLPLA